MKTIKVNLPEDLKTAEIHIFSDWHIGDRHSKLDEIRAEVDEVRQNPNAYVICNGDLVNNATKTSVSDSYAELIPPMDQISFLTNVLAPVKEKILLITQGNHEARTYRNDGIDLTAIVAEQLGISERYAREGGVLFVRLGHDRGIGKYAQQICYTIYSTHGSGGGRKEGAKTIRLADMASIVDADIYIHGHTHLPLIMKQGFYRTSYQHSTVAYTEKLFINASAKLEYGGYGQTFEFKPSSTASPVIYLSGVNKKMWAKM